MICAVKNSHSSVSTKNLASLQFEPVVGFKSSDRSRAPIFQVQDVFCANCSREVSCAAFVSCKFANQVSIITEDNDHSPNA